MIGRIKMKKITVILKSFIVCAFISASIAGCNTIKLNSKLSKGDVVIDGTDKEWEGVRSYMKDQNIVVGIQNDEKYLYLLLSPTTDEISRQVMARGLTIWFDSKCGKHEKFGVHYPLGLQKQDLAYLNLDRQTSKFRGKPDENVDMNKLFEVFSESESLNEIEITGPEEYDYYKGNVNDVKGIEAKITKSNNSIVYELKVPLDKDSEHPYGICTEPEKSITIGFKTPEIKLREKKEDFGRGNRGGGFGGPGGRGERPSGGEMPGGMPGGMQGGREIPKNFELWIKTKLAE